MGISSPLLVIEHAIMHPLNRSANTPALVTQEIDLDDGGRDYLSRVIRASMGQADNYGVEQETGSAALNSCWMILENCAELVTQSQVLTISLSALMAKNRHIKPGDLLMVVAQDDFGRLLAILKMDAGRQFERVYSRQGNGWKVELRPNDQVVPSEDKPPQKCAFVRERNATGFGYHALLHDDQIHQEGIAQFFYHEFLGCELIPTPVRRTEAFVQTAEHWRHQHRRELHDLGIAALVQALWDHLNQPHVDFQEFARAALSGSAVSDADIADLRDTIAKAVYEDKPEPRPTSFSPHEKTVEKLLGTMTISLGDSIKLVAPVQQIIQILSAVTPDTGDRQWVFNIRRPVVELSVPNARRVAVPIKNNENGTNN